MLPDTRKKILLNATKLFAEKGYEGVRTKEIANVSGISEVTLFKYFPQKEVLYNSLIDEYFHTLDLSPIVDNLDFVDLNSNILEIASAIVENLIENADIILMRQKEKRDFLNNKKFDILANPSYITILPVFQKYYRDKVISFSPENAANTFIISIVGSFGLLVGNNFNELYFRKYVKNFVDIFCNGIRTSE
jgi:AcrR family transcriptional regulator